MNKSDIKLEHVLIEIRYQRGNHLGHFIEQYFCYKLGYVNKNGNAKWNSLFSKE